MSPSAETKMTLSDDAWDGTLTYNRLENYIAIDRSVLDKPGGKKGITPLAAACSAGRQDMVQLLLDANADVNAPSPQNRTPLFYATRRPKTAPIVRLLILHDAKPNIQDDLGTSPLMNAVSQTRDKDTIHELVDHGADVSAVNNKGKSVKDMAKVAGLEQDLKPRDERVNSSRTEIVNLIVSLVLFVIAYVNSGVLKDAVQGVAKKLYDISGEKTPEVEQAVDTKATTVKELTASLDNYVQDTGLKKFFAPGDSFLQNLATKAANLRGDKTTRLGEPENLKRLTVLSLYQPVIYCDDSSSMAQGNRLASMQELVSRIASVATRIVPDGLGVELRFINSNTSYSNSAQGIMTAVKSVQPSRGTRIGSGLRDKILQPLVYDVISKPGGHLQRPIMVCVITDGAPSGEQPNDFKGQIVRCRHTLVSHGYEPNAVMFCVSQIGDDPGARDFLDRLQEDEDIEDVIHVTADRLDDALRQQEQELEVWLLKLLTSPLMDSTD
ncbi:hypothetical protein FS842_010001 [Serendipita sp. 407]|nr:hypothetical protein FS842_010001 [Serendipita sp. 407]